MAAPLASAHLRIALPTNDIAALKHFYCAGLGFEILFEFQDQAGEHAGFDGVMLGHASAGYHLEFTRKEGHDAGRAPTRDNLLVFYLPDLDVWTGAVERMRGAGYEAVEPFNEYWKAKGRTFEDPDGYRVVLQNAEWSNERALAARSKT